MRAVFPYFLRAHFWRVACLGLLLHVASDAKAATYTFTNIADNTTAGPFGQFTSFGIPAISGSTVAFTASSGALYDGVFTGSGGPLTTIVKWGDAAPSGVFTSGFGDPTISGASVAFFAPYSGMTEPSGIFIGSGGPLKTVAKTGDPGPSGTLHDLSAPVISGGMTAFMASYTGGAGVFTGDGGPLTYVNTGLNPSISGGTVAFQSYVNGDPEVFTQSGAVLTSFGVGGNPSISGGGVAFLGADNDGSIILVNGGQRTTIMQSGDPAPVGNILDWRAPATDGTNVAFFAFYGDRQQSVIEGVGIFVGWGGPLKPVIKTGDPLFGSTVVSLLAPGSGNWFGLDPEGSGNVAFGYSLADGRFGIAAVHLVPEPSSFALVAIGGWALLRRRLVIRT